MPLEESVPVGGSGWSATRADCRERIASGTLHLPKRDHMIKTVEAVIDEKGNVKLLEHVRLGVARRALVTIFDEKPTARASETALLSEVSLGEDWSRPEEDEAWSHLQRVR